MSDVITFREFVSPHDYVYQDGCIRQGKLYQCNNKEGTGGRWIEADWELIPLDDDEGINAATSLVLQSLQSQIDKNNEEIEYLHRLIGLLVFELTDQGIKVEDKELINQINYI